MRSATTFLGKAILLSILSVLLVTQPIQAEVAYSFDNGSSLVIMDVEREHSGLHQPAVAYSSGLGVSSTPGREAGSRTLLFRASNGDSMSVRLTPRGTDVVRAHVDDLFKVDLFFKEVDGERKISRQVLRFQGESVEIVDVAAGLPYAVSVLEDLRATAQARYTTELQLELTEAMIEVRRDRLPQTIGGPGVAAVYNGRFKKDLLECSLSTISLIGTYLGIASCITGSLFSCGVTLALHDVAIASWAITCVDFLLRVRNGEYDDSGEGDSGDSGSDDGSGSGGS